jgi:hypothetical protein
VRVESILMSIDDSVRSCNSPKGRPADSRRKWGQKKESKEKNGMWEVLFVEAETPPPELEGIAGDYGHANATFSLSRRGDPDTTISLVDGRVAAITRSGVRYELTPTTEPNVYVVLVNGKTYLIRIYYYCKGPRPAVPPNARNLACPVMLTEKVPCSFSCDTGFVLSERRLRFGSLACTASGTFTANSSCVRVGAHGSSAPTPETRATSAPTPEVTMAPSALIATKLEVTAPIPEAPTPEVGVQTVAATSSGAWMWILLVLAIGVAVYFLASRRGS